MDATGKLERGALVTTMTVLRGNGQGNLTYMGAYDADGQLVQQGMPGQLATHCTYDPAGQLTDLTYTCQVTPVTEATDRDTGENTGIPVHLCRISRGCRGRVGMTSLVG